MYYLTLTGGDDIESAKTKMFTNTTDSIIKTTVDNWYKNNMTGYTSKLEDTIYCNDWTFSTGALISKDTSSTDYNYFAGYTRINSSNPSLKCSNPNDAFTVSSNLGNGKLTYPVGLITADEIMYAGGKNDSYNSTYYLYTNQHLWSGTPYRFKFTATDIWGVVLQGNVGYDMSTSGKGVRPVVSLSPSIEISSGSGTSTDPYIVK